MILPLRMIAICGLDSTRYLSWWESDITSKWEGIGDVLAGMQGTAEGKS
jgi:hypothetical protein